MAEHSHFLHHYGFTIEVHRGGRRVWPPSFKRFIRSKVESNELSVEDITRECHVSKSLVYKWMSDTKGTRSEANDKAKLNRPGFTGE